MTQFLRAQWKVVSTVATIAVLLTACNKGQQAAAPAVSETPAVPPEALVNGTPIPRTDYDAFLKNLLQGKPATDLTAEQKNQVLDELITMQLVSTQAVKDGLEKEPDVAANLDVMHMRILSDAESQKILKGKEPTDAQLHAEYDSAIASMDKSEYHAEHILVPTKEKAEQLIKKIKAGAKFEDVAKAESTDNSKANGGDLGWFTLTRMVKPFGDAVKTLKKGEMTQEPVQTQFGWHVILCEGKRAGPTPALADVQEQIRQTLADNAIKATLADVRGRVKVELYNADGTASPQGAPAK